MKKIYTKSVFIFNSKTNTFDLDHDESEFHYVDDDAKISYMKGDSTPATTTTTSEPWAPQQPYITSGLENAKQAFLDTPPYMPEFDPATIAAQNGILNAANTPGLYGDTSSMIDKTLRGDYLTGGEGFNAALNAARNEIIPKVQSEFAARGRTGSGLAQTAETGAIGDAFSKLYEQERENQLRAGALAPGVDEMKYAETVVLGIGFWFESTIFTFT